MTDRYCDECAIKMPPYIPRKRKGDKQVCWACYETTRGGYVSAEPKTAAGDFNADQGLGGAMKGVIEHLTQEHGLRPETMGAMIRATQGTTPDVPEGNPKWEDDPEGVTRNVQNMVAWHQSMHRLHRDVLHHGDYQQQPTSPDALKHGHGFDDPLAYSQNSYKAFPDSISGEKTIYDPNKPWRDNEPVVKGDYHPPYTHKQEYEHRRLSPHRTDDHPNLLGEERPEWGDENLSERGKCPHTYRLMDYSTDEKCPHCGVDKMYHAEYKPSEIGQATPEENDRRVQQFNERVRGTGPVKPLPHSLNARTAMTWGDYLREFADNHRRDNPERHKQLHDDADEADATKGVQPGEDLPHNYGNTVGWVKARHLKPYLAHQGDQHGMSQQEIGHLQDEFQRNGWKDSLMFLYHHGTHSGIMGEGNHRLHAQLRNDPEGYVPLRVVRAYDGEANAGKLKPLPSGTQKTPMEHWDEHYDEYHQPDMQHPSEVLPDEWMHPGHQTTASVYGDDEVLPEVPCPEHKGSGREATTKCTEPAGTAQQKADRMNQLKTHLLTSEHGDYLTPEIKSLIFDRNSQWRDLAHYHNFHHLVDADYEKTLRDRNHSSRVFGPEDTWHIHGARQESDPQHNPADHTLYGDGLNCSYCGQSAEYHPHPHEGEWARCSLCNKDMSNHLHDMGRWEHLEHGKYQLPSPPVSWLFDTYGDDYPKESKKTAVWSQSRHPEPIIHVMGRRPPRPLQTGDTLMHPTTGQTHQIVAHTPTLLMLEGRSMPVFRSGMEGDMSKAIIGETAEDRAEMEKKLDVGSPEEKEFLEGNDQGPSKLSSRDQASCPHDGGWNLHGQCKLCGYIPPTEGDEPCDNPWCVEHEPEHTKAEHIDPPHLDPGHPDYQSAAQEVGEHPDAWLLDHNDEGPSKFSKLAHGDHSNFLDGHRHTHIELSDQARDDMMSAADAGKAYAEYAEQAQKTPADLSHPQELRQHMIDAHEEGGWVHSAPDGDVRQEHDDQHREYHEDWPNAIYMDNHHFHEAVRKTARAARYDPDAVGYITDGGIYCPECATNPHRYPNSHYNIDDWSPLHEHDFNDHNSNPEGEHCECGNEIQPPREHPTSECWHGECDGPHGPGGSCDVCGPESGHSTAEHMQMSRGERPTPHHEVNEDTAWHGPNYEAEDPFAPRRAKPEETLSHIDDVLRGHGKKRKKPKPQHARGGFCTTCYTPGGNHTDSCSQADSDGDSDDSGMSATAIYGLDEERPWPGDCYHCEEPLVHEGNGVVSHEDRELNSHHDPIPEEAEDAFLNNLSDFHNDLHRESAIYGDEPPKMRVMQPHELYGEFFRHQPNDNTSLAHQTQRHLDEQHDPQALKSTLHHYRTQVGMQPDDKMYQEDWDVVHQIMHRPDHPIQPDHSHEHDFDDGDYTPDKNLFSLNSLASQLELFDVPHNNHLPNPAEGGHDWHHGTPKEIEDLRSDPYGDDPNDYEPDYEREHKRHWNSYLGDHWTSLRPVADKFAIGEYHHAHEHDNGEGSTFTANLRMKDPKIYTKETKMDSEAVRHAWNSQDHHDPEEAHKEYCHDDNCDHVEDHTGDEVDQRMKDHYARPDHAANWLNSHHNKEDIAWQFQQHLKRQGHDGVVYGNEIEGPTMHPCAITFDKSQVENVRRSAPQHTGWNDYFGTDAYKRNGGYGWVHDINDRLEDQHHPAHQAVLAMINEDGEWIEPQDPRHPDESENHFEDPREFDQRSRMVTPDPNACKACGKDSQYVKGLCRDCWQNYGQNLDGQPPGMWETDSDETKERVKDALHPKTDEWGRGWTDQPPAMRQSLNSLTVTAGHAQVHVMGGAPPEYPHAFMPVCHHPDHHNDPQFKHDYYDGEPGPGFWNGGVYRGNDTESEGWHQAWDEAKAHDIRYHTSGDSSSPDPDAEYPF